MAAYIDAHRDRFEVGPICRVLGAASDCGFLTPRGYRMFKTRPPSRMKARHEALEQAISWAAGHGGTRGLVHHSDHGSQYISTVYTTRVREYGMLPSTGTVGDSYDNAMAESADGAYKTELVWRRKPFRDVGDLELATFQWVSWWNSKRLHASLDYRTPEQVETEYYTNQATQAASL